MRDCITRVAPVIRKVDSPLQDPLEIKMPGWGPPCALGFGQTHKRCLLPRVNPLLPLGCSERAEALATSGQEWAHGQVWVPIPTRAGEPLPSKADWGYGQVPESWRRN